jgi:hypothetical protein
MLFPTGKLKPRPFKEQRRQDRPHRQLPGLIVVRMCSVNGLRLPTGLEPVSFVGDKLLARLNFAGPPGIAERRPEANG